MGRVNISIPPRYGYFYCMVGIIITSVLCHISFANGQDIAVLKSLNVKPYNDVLKGFKIACCNSKVREFVLNGQDSDKEVRKMHPDLIIAIGKAALVRAKGLEDIPIVFTMVADPESIIHENLKITGVGMVIPPERQLRSLLEILPNTKRVGVIYDPELSASLYAELIYAASTFGIMIVPEAVQSSKEVSSAMEDLKGKVDALLMLPDKTVITKETVESLVLFSFEYRIPIVSFSEKYVEMGALMALSIDAADIGMQAGEAAKKILGGADVPFQTPRTAVISINLKTAKKLGINVSEELIMKSKVIR